LLKRAIDDKVLDSLVASFWEIRLQCEDRPQLANVFDDSGKRSIRGKNRYARILVENRAGGPLPRCRASEGGLGAGEVCRRPSTSIGSMRAIFDKDSKAGLKLARR
jgi:hypothetical protein